jgi:2-polyprenyl-3-methyl-5-hydroxy-6-metoxy-1,4-benzoquinol methylase
MNRKQRRAAQSNLQDAARRQRQAVAREPENAQAHNELACMLLQQGKPDQAAAHFERALTLMPELFEQYPALVATLINVNPAARAGLARAANAAQGGLSPNEILDPSELATLSRDPLLRCMLECAPVRDLNLERYLASVRRSLAGLLAGLTSHPLAPASGGGKGVEALPDVRENDALLALCCALARQCFINEYVFAATAEEIERAAALRDKVADALEVGRPAPLQVAILATYFPLSDLAGAERLLGGTWPACLQAVLTQQLLEPREEKEDRDKIPRLTKIEDRVSRLVGQQYEENPYPRWVVIPSNRGPTSVEQYLRAQFSAASFASAAPERQTDILIAGCGTGQQSIMTARRFAAANVLAVDLSRNSLCYARRMSRLLDVHNIQYAQADVLELASIGRPFDMIEASGVLHHLADPTEGWRVLASLLRPGGFMHVGLYSKAARREIEAARAYVAERGFGTSAQDIRRCRQEILSTPMKSVAQFADFFTVSECRDLLFHVQEHTLSIPQIGSFLREHNFTFIGFELPPQTAAGYRYRFPEDRSMTNLNSWNVFEAENPRTFAGMYQFWIQKN